MSSSRVQNTGSRHNMSFNPSQDQAYHDIEQKPADRRTQSINKTAVISSLDPLTANLPKTLITDQRFKPMKKRDSANKDIRSQVSESVDFSRIPPIGLAPLTPFGQSRNLETSAQLSRRQNVLGQSLDLVGKKALL